MKKFRRSIRINGKEVKSPYFERASDAERWYSKKLLHKQLTGEGLHLPVDEATTLIDYFKKVWLPRRRLKYPKSTWVSDAQRFRDYIELPLGALKVAKINSLQVRTALKAVVEKHGCSVQTRNRVRALCSKIFNDAMNEDTPLRTDNPAINISFNDPRSGKKNPSFIAREPDVVKFLRSAKELSPNHYIYASIALMAGPRKSELSPLTWADFDPGDCTLRLNKRFMQAANEIVNGLKSGSEEERIVPIPDDLVKLLKLHKRRSDHQGEDDFILCKDNGKCFGPKDIHKLHEDIREVSGVDVTPHGLRHTYGRQFVLKNGNMKALQAILGHSNSQTTDLYSRLAGKTVSKFRNTVSFNLDEEDED